MPSATHIQKTLGVFLLGLAALAVFDYWFPGILLLSGAVWLWYGYHTHRLLQQTPAGWFLLLVGSVFVLRDATESLPPPVFPLVVLFLAVSLLTWVDLSKWLKRL